MFIEKVKIVFRILAAFRMLIPSVLIAFLEQMFHIIWKFNSDTVI